MTKRFKEDPAGEWEWVGGTLVDPTITIRKRPPAEKSNAELANNVRNVSNDQTFQHALLLDIVDAKIAKDRKEHEEKLHGPMGNRLVEVNSREVRRNDYP